MKLPTCESTSSLTLWGIRHNNWHTSFMTVSCFLCVMLGIWTYSDIAKTDLSVMSDIGACDVNDSCIVYAIMNLLSSPNIFKGHKHFLTKVIKVIAVCVSSHIRINVETDISAMYSVSMDHSWYWEWRSSRTIKWWFVTHRCCGWSPRRFGGLYAESFTSSVSDMMIPEGAQSYRVGCYTTV
jgi:hypothetical protein